ncbi:MAG TPA: glycosyltransferase [Vicinamibacterales bacterium]|nr:glycosyltransferase [Vicinamibacterales bacterium]
MSDRDVLAGRKVVLVHDWLTGMRGGERVLESLCRMFPDADLLTLVHVPGSVSPTIERRRVRTSIVQRLPLAGRLYRQYLPVFPTAIELFDLDDCDLVISTSHCAAKAVVAPGRAVHVCYCFSPMRYAWDQFDAYFGPERVGAGRSALLRRIMAGIARWDRDTAPRVHRFLADSHYVAGRIARYYNRVASVLYPPVDTAFFTPDGNQPEPHFLVVSALVPYKRIDLAIAAAGRLGVRLRIVGTGPDEAHLRAAAGPTVEFLGSVDDAALRDEFRRARAVILPGEEDFGIVPVEALACGRPVVAFGRGGACETVAHETTGLLVDEATPEAFASAMDAVTRREWDPALLRSHAEPFAIDRFEVALRGVLSNSLAAAS